MLFIFLPSKQVNGFSLGIILSSELLSDKLSSVSRYDNERVQDHQRGKRVLDSYLSVLNILFIHKKTFSYLSPHNYNGWNMFFASLPMVVNSILKNLTVIITIPLQLSQYLQSSLPDKLCFYVLKSSKSSLCWLLSSLMCS